MTTAAARSLAMKQAAASLPFTARSLTHDQVRAAVRKELIWMAASLALLVAFFGALVTFTRRLPPQWPLLIVIGIALVLMYVVSTVRKVRRGAAYVDPLVRIDVGDSGIEIDRSGLRESTRYKELAVTNILAHSTKGGVYFEGIAIQTSSGALQLGDKWFDGGNAAAGAILRRMEQLGVSLHLPGGIFS